MNAYELADQVEMWGEDLLALNMKGGIPVVEGANMLRQQADRIAELEKILEQEGIGVGRDLLNGGIALFKKPQTKPLSDEEIKVIANNLTCTPDKNWNVLFARAILKKASEK